MRSFVRPEAGWSEEDLDVELLDGPPPLGFDCGRAEQNEFLYDRAWRDSAGAFSATRLFFVKGILAAYVTTGADAIDLGSREKDPGVRYSTISALKIFQLAVDRRFAGCGLGRFLVGYVIAYAQEMRRQVAWRYVTLDAQPELEYWYTAQGFVRNKLLQKRRVEHAVASGRNPGELTVSMRYDLLRPTGGVAPPSPHGG